MASNDSIETRIDKVIAQLEDEGAYMYDAYGETEIRDIARFLLEQGHLMSETAAVIRSKHMRWASDWSDGLCTRGAFVVYYRMMQTRNLNWDIEVARIASETYGA